MLRCKSADYKWELNQTYGVSSKELAPPIYINKASISRVYSFKFLGVLLDVNLKFKDHVKTNTNWYLPSLAHRPATSIRRCYQGSDVSQTARRGGCEGEELLNHPALYFFIFQKNIIKLKIQHSVSLFLRNFEKY